MKSLLLAACATASLAFGSNAPDERDPNPALLGVVVEDTLKGPIVRHVVKKSPAYYAGILRDDIVLLIDKQDVYNALGLDEILAEFEGREQIEVTVMRGRLKKKIDVTLIQRTKYKGKELSRQRALGEVNFKAPEWLIGNWTGVAKRSKPPTRKSTRGKIVVIHAFQSW